jgi:hypothetical protein
MTFCLAFRPSGVSNTLDGEVGGYNFSQSFRISNILRLVCLYLAWKKSSFGTFCVIDLDSTMPRYCRTVPEKHIRRRRYRKHAPETNDPWLEPRVPKAVTDEDDQEEGDDQDATTTTEAKKQKLNDSTSQPVQDPNQSARACTICLQYNGILYMDFIGEGEMVVVEQPWLEVVETFPEALQRRIYGCN